ncbi:hypothetical protein QUF80_19105 [Desulfococcaceae bacterium HSG8]|nr:hypothetical protein [Desulfococcaceae bacterium HSG8]
MRHIRINAKILFIILISFKLWGYCFDACCVINWHHASRFTLHASPSALAVRVGKSEAPCVRGICQSPASLRVGSRFTHYSLRITLHAPRIDKSEPRVCGGFGNPPRAYEWDHVSRFTFHVSRFTFHVSRFTFHVSRITHYASLITHHASRITFHASHSRNSYFFQQILTMFPSLF